MEMLINGKTPIEIRDAHARCREGVCDGCAYYDHIDCETDLNRDTIDLINSRCGLMISDDEIGFNIEEIYAYLEFWAVDCEGEGYPCGDECPYHDPCRTLSSEDHRRMARNIRRLIDTLNDRILIAGRRIPRIYAEMDVALTKAQKRIEKRNALLAAMGVLIPEDEEA